jgi:hypothetical protein
MFSGAMRSVQSELNVSWGALICGPHDGVEPNQPIRYLRG